jgi:hypothetical protein
MICSVSASMSVSIFPVQGFRPGRLRHRTAVVPEFSVIGVVTSTTSFAKYSAIRFAGPLFGAIMPSSSKKSVRCVYQVLAICVRLSDRMVSTIFSKTAADHTSQVRRLRVRRLKNQT